MTRRTAILAALSTVACQVKPSTYEPPIQSLTLGDTVTVEWAGRRIVLNTSDIWDALSHDSSRQPHEYAVPPPYGRPEFWQGPWPPDGVRYP